MVVYEVATLSVPWDGFETMQIVFAIGQNKRPPLPVCYDAKETRKKDQPPDPPYRLPDEVLVLMRSCWDANPEARPDFSQIVDALAAAIKSANLPS